MNVSHTSVTWSLGRFLRQALCYGWIGLAPLFLTACADLPQAQEEYDQPQPVTEADKLKLMTTMRQRLDRVSSPLLINNAGLCRKQVRNLLGFSAANKYSFSPFAPELVAQTLQLGERLQATYVVAQSGAARAGLRAGDQIIEINGKKAPQGKNAENDIVRILAPIVAKNAPVNLTISRNDRLHKLHIPLTPSCGFRVEIGYVDIVNAYTDGQRILITKGMMQATRNDRELSYVVAREMAHNMLGHTRYPKDLKNLQRTIDQLIQGNTQHLPQLKTYTEKQDRDADTLSFALALRGGYTLEGATPFWKRMATQYSDNSADSYAARHPFTEARMEAMPTSIKRVETAHNRRKARNRR